MHFYMKGEINLYICTGLKIRGCREPRAPLSATAAPSNFCREPKYTEHFHEAYDDAIGLPGINLNFEP